MKKLSLFLSLVAVIFASQDRANAALVVGLTETNSLVKFSTNAPGTLIGGSVPVTGLNSGEDLKSIDFRPANNLLYGLGVAGSTGTIYEINPDTGAATTVLGGIAVSGTEFGIDFNPVPNALRIVSNSGQNLRIAQNLTVVNVDGNLNPGSPNVVGAGYINNFAGATTTTLYVIDASNPSALQLNIQMPPNAGTLMPVGSLNVGSNSQVGFDITSDNMAFASLTNNDASSLYSINLSTGNATEIGMIGGEALDGIAIPVPVPPTILGSILGLGFGAWFKTKKKTKLS